MRYWKIGALLLVVAAAYWKGGVDTDARYVARDLREAEADAAATEKLIAYQEANRKLAQALEDKAYAEPITNDCGLPVSRVLRLNER